VHQLEWKKQARKDLLKIIEHIAKDNPDAADKLADDIEAKAQQLRERPGLYRAGRKRATRHAGNGHAAELRCDLSEKGAAFFLFGALQQFFSDGNKRTARFMMNGIDAISVPAAKAQAFNEKMVRFYLTKDATEMMAFSVDCHPEAAQIHAANPDPGKTAP